MKSDDEAYFAVQVQPAHRNYKRTDDWESHIGDCTQAAVLLYAAEQEIPLSLVAAELSSPVFRRAVGLVAESLTCPVDAAHSAQSFLIAIGWHLRDRTDPCIAPIKQVLDQLGIVTERSGFL